MSTDLFDRDLLVHAIDPTQDGVGWASSGKAMKERGIASARLLEAGEEPLLGFWIEAGVLAQERLDERPVTGSAEQALRAVVAAGRRADEQLMLANVRLVYYWAIRRSAGRSTGGLDLEDLVSEGLLGLRRAIMKWDFRRGLKFSTYASGWIRQAIGRAITRAHALHLSQEDQVALARLRDLRDSEAVVGRVLTVSAVRSHMDVTAARARDLLNLLTAEHPISLFEKRFDEKQVGDAIPDPSSGPAEVAEARCVREELTAALAGLSDRERAVLCARVGWDGQAPASCDEVARRFGVSVGMVESVTVAGLQRLRGHFDALAWSA